MTEKMPSSVRFGSRPIMPTMSPYSSSVRPCWSRVFLSIMAGPFPADGAAGRFPPFEAENEGGEDRPAVLAPEEGLRSPLRVGHQAEDVAFPVPDAGDIPEGAVDVGLLG